MPTLEISTSKIIGPNFEVGSQFGSKFPGPKFKIGIREMQTLYVMQKAIHRIPIEFLGFRNGKAKLYTSILVNIENGFIVTYFSMILQ
jgi:hypothetical protein